MKNVQDIEAAIRALPLDERKELVRSLPSIFPEIAIDLEWSRIVNDPRPRPELSLLGDRIEADLKPNPDAFPEIHEEDFERNS